MRTAPVLLLVVALSGGRAAAQDVSPLIHDAIISAPAADVWAAFTRIAFEPGRMLALQVANPPRGFPFPTAIQQMWTVLYFEPLDDRRTRVRSVALGFGPGEESQQMRAFFQQGNATTLAQLQKRFMQGGGP